MGTINYKTGDIITLGLNTNNLEDEWYDTEDGRECFTEEEQTEDAYFMLKELTEEVEDKICNNFDNQQWFKINVEYGYYEGVSVTVDKDYFTDAEFNIKRRNGELLSDLYKLTKEEKEEIKLQLEIIREFCIKCLDYVDVCYPSWCTGYKEGYAENVDAVNNAFDKAIKELGL